MSAHSPRDSEDGPPPHDSPTPDACQIPYGSGTGRELFVAVADVLACSGVGSLSEVAEFIDLEAVERLGQGSEFAVTLPLSHGTLTITDQAVRVDRD